MYVTTFPFVVSIELQHAIKVPKTFLFFKRNTQNNKTRLGAVKRYYAHKIKDSTNFT